MHQLIWSDGINCDRVHTNYYKLGISINIQ